MDERIVQFRVGVVVLATVIIAAILILLFSRTPWLGIGQKYYSVYAIFDDAPGIADDTPVRKSGILIGRVKKVRFIDNDRKVEIASSIREDIQLWDNDVCRIASANLLGDSFLEFVPKKGTKTPKEPVSPGHVFQGEVPISPLQILADVKGDLGKTITSLGDAGTQVSQLANQLNGLLAENTDQINAILEKTELALESITVTTNTVQGILGDKQIQEELRRTLTELPTLLSQTQETVLGMQKSIQLANANLNNLEGFTRPLGERGEMMVNKMDSAVGQLDEILSQILVFSRTINSEEGTLGQLVSNPDLYNNLNQAVVNVEKITCQLRPILQNLRVFSDKIARDPGRIGVRGVFRKETGIK